MTPEKPSGFFRRLMLERDVSRAAKTEQKCLAELVLWIGYLQWHFRTHGTASPAEPVLRDFKNIENRDAVLAWESRRERRDENGKPVTRWDGIGTV